MLWRELCALFDDYFRICFPVVPCRETALKICPSFFFLSLFFLPFDLQSSFIVRLLKQQKGKADVWPSECHSCKSAATASEQLNSNEALWEYSSLLVLARARLWCCTSYQGLDGRERKAGNEIKTKVFISLMPCRGSACRRIFVSSPNVLLVLH